MKTIQNDINAKPLISILIPAYNVEQYIDKCLASVCRQTMTQLEIILINDGSTDNTPAICDAWAEKDNRIRIIHQENKGIAETRNVGIATASAPYIGFVDSDDWIEPEMFEILFKAIKKHDAQIAMCGVMLEYPLKNAPDKKHDSAPKPCVIKGKEGLMKVLWDRETKSYCCNKIFDKTLFQHTLFPAGRTFEDYSAVYLLFAKAQRLTHTGRSDYHYIQHENSILNAVNPRKEVDFFIANMERYAFISSYPAFTRKEKKKLQLKTLKRMMRTYCNLLKKTDKNMLKEEKQWMHKQMEVFYGKSFDPKKYKKQKFGLSVKSFLAEMGF